jgi:hypothetical protein
MTGHNVGDLLNNAGITWGWFYADFTAQTGSTSTHAVCSSNYDVHYDPFQYYPSTVNPHHLPPTSTALIGRQGDQANHQYDLNSFSAALNAGNLPAVSFLKAPSTATGHPQDGSTLSEQTFIVDMVNALQNPNTGRTWRSSSRMTTAMAGTTTSCRRSSTTRTIPPPLWPEVSTASAPSFRRPQLRSTTVAAMASVCLSS